MKKLKKLRKKFRPIRFLFEYIGVLCVYYPVRLIPLRAVFAFANFAGFFLYMIPPQRKLIIANLKVAFPDKTDSEIRTLARKNATNIVLLILEFFWFIDRPEKAEELVTLNDDGKNIIDKAKREGKGLIWATPHLGNWELAGLAISSRQDMPFAVVVRTMNNPYLNKLINSGRESVGNRVIPAKGAIKGMIKALKEGFFMATLVDQNTKAKEGGVFVDFFGLPVTSSRAPALFARKFNSLVAVGGAVRKGNRYEFVAIELPKESVDYESDEELLQDIITLTEGLIRQYPDQYLWMYERWRFIPEGLDEEKRKRYPFYGKEVTPRFFNHKAPK